MFTFAANILIMIVVTGAAGFIGSCLVAYLNENGFENLILVDDFSKTEKDANLKDKKYIKKIERSVFVEWLEANGSDVDFVYHIGARTDTAEFDWDIFVELNLAYSKAVWENCVKQEIPFVYASSAATYGGGELGYKDDHNIIEKLKPLNPYGDSKNEFDKWVLKQENTPPFWAGFKFFNVFGPNEYHKSRMASVVFHAFNQITKTGGMNLFKSHRPDFEDGMQLRDFVYVKDLVKVLFWTMESKPESAIYNLGTGTARSFLDLVKATFKAMNIEENIGFIPTPEDIRDKYQYFTEADMSKLIEAGYKNGFDSLEDAVNDYVVNYLAPNKVY